MIIRGHRVVHLVMAAILVFSLMPNTVVSAQPATPKNLELTSGPRITANPSPPPNPLDINLLDLLPGKEQVLPSRDVDVVAQSIAPGNTDLPGSSQIQANPPPLSNPYELNSVNFADEKENPIQFPIDNAPIITPTSSETEPLTNPQIKPNPLPALNKLEPISVEVLPDKQTILESKDGKVKVTFPAGAVTENVRVEYKEQRPRESTGMRMLRLFELNGYAINRKNAPVNTFKKQLQISISHTKEELAGLDTRSLRLYYLDEKQNRWLPVTSQYNAAAGTLTSSTDHFTYYGEQANPNISGPGTVMNFQVGLQSGTAISRYPIELPPGPGGFQPGLELVYNSGSVDEMKNKRSLGSWVGIGWTFHPGRISLDEEYKSYSLEMNGESYEIISADGSTYYTKPDMFFKITRTGQTWNMWDRSGVKYQFGGTIYSQQYHDTTEYYRWDLNLVQDTHGNQMTVSYVRDIVGTNVRSAYPEYLRYNNNLVEVHFISSNDQQDPNDGPIRNDNPRSYGSNPAPKVMENRKLDTIEVKASGNLVRKYGFNYITIASTYSPDYGGIYYSGKHTLTSITQKGADGTSTLPAMSFSYSDLQIYLNDSYNPTYTGNPGNPASFNWPHLTQVRNGYGATVTFTYMQNPVSSTNNIWTREVVVRKDVDPGIGPVQTYNYDYTGDPVYMWHSWKARFRGFREVKEVDAALNYVRHYYYTTGQAADGKDADKLTGKEYKTRWYSSTGTLLKENVYDWGVPTTQLNKYAFVSQFTGQGSSDGDLNFPLGIAVDGNKVYVADSGNNRVQKFSSSGVFLSKWGVYGSANGEFKTPSGVGVDGSGSVYVADSSNNRIQVFDSSDYFLRQWPVGWIAGFAVVDSSGTSLVTDASPRIREYTSSGFNIRNIDCPPSWDEYNTYPCVAKSVARDQALKTYVVDDGRGALVKLDLAGNQLAVFGGMGSVAVDNQGYVWLAENLFNRISKYNSSGALVGAWGSLGVEEGQFYSPSAVAFDSYGNVYVTEGNGSRVQKFSAGMTFQKAWGHRGDSSGRLGTPQGVAAYGNNIYVTDSYWGRVYKFDPYGAQVSRWGSSFQGFGELHAPYGVSPTSANVYVVDPQWSRVVKLDASGNFVSKWGSFGSGNGQFIYPTDLATDSAGNVYVADTGNHRIQKFDASGNPSYPYQWGSYGSGNGQFNYPYGITVDSANNIYVADMSNYRIQKFDTWGAYLGQWGSQGSGPGQFFGPYRVVADGLGNIYVAEGNHRIQKFSGSGDYITQWGSYGSGFGSLNMPMGIVPFNNDVYVADTGNKAIQRFSPLWTVQLNQVDETTYGGANKASRVKYFYDSYGNVVKTERHGDIGITTDDSTIYTVFYPNTTAWIVNKPARERLYQGIKSADDGSNLKKESLYYYDGNNSSLTTPPPKGDLTKAEGKIDASTSVSTVYTYDSYGNQISITDPNGNTSSFTYDTTNHSLPMTRSYPLIGSETYTWDYGAGKILTEIDVNGQTTTIQYDTFKRPITIRRPGDETGIPTIEHRYESWGTINQQRVETFQKTGDSTTLWQKRYFDGLGWMVQFQAQGETGKTIVTTTAFNNRGLTDKEYVPQNLDSSSLSGYKTPEAGWKSTSYVYDALNRVTTATKPDATTIIHNFDTPWQDTATNERGKQKKYYSDAFGRLVKVEELNDSQAVYATTSYTYDVLSNLKTVTDAMSNPTTINYDWLSRKTSMTDPDMGTWSYTYDASSNLITQTDAKGQVLKFEYDTLNRLTKKCNTNCSETILATYTYDDINGGNYGKGHRTGASYKEGTQYGSDTYKYDNRGRMIKEVRSIIGDTSYTTEFTYDSADRLVSVKYPTTPVEEITQTYNGRGLLNTLSSSISSNLVNSTLYNQLGQPTEINLGNNILKMTFGYWGLTGTYDNPGNYYGRLWEIKTFKPGFSPHQDVQHTWDAGGNLTVRQNLIDSETENFQYDFLDRLTGVTGAYSESYQYNEIGNLITKGGKSYDYTRTPGKPHAVKRITEAGNTTDYTYDANGNMQIRTGTGLAWDWISWDAENRPTSIKQGGQTGTEIAGFIYDGDGKRVKKTENNQTTIYVNRYYEKTGNDVTLYYYLGDRLVAFKKNGTMEYVHQDHLTGTSVTTNSSGDTLLGKIAYFPFGATRSTYQTIDTEKKFTGQRLDGSTGLYLMQSSAPVWAADAPVSIVSAPLTVSAVWAGRYYDPAIGRFTQADTIVPDPGNPQAFNRYSYVANNPLKYVDPSGHFWDWIPDAFTLAFDVYQLILDPSEENASNLRVDMVLAVTPFVPAGVGPLKAAGRAIDRAEQIARNAETGRLFQRAAGKALEAKGITLGRPVSRVTPSGDKVILDFFSNKLVAYEAKHIDWTAKCYQTESGLMGKLKSIAKQVREQKGALDTAKGETHGGVILNRPDDARTVEKVGKYFKKEYIDVMWID